MIKKRKFRQYRRNIKQVDDASGHGRLDEKVGLRSESVVAFADNALDGAKKGEDRP